MTRDVPGIIVEGGSGLGMSIAVFYILCKAAGIEREFWTYDSFEGLPEPSPEDLASAQSLAKKGDLNYGGMEVVLNKLAEAGVSKEEIGNSVKLVKGWFNETMPKYDGPEVAILHIDGDLYESTMTTLENFWPRLSVGGVVIFDEYDNVSEWPGEKQAADEFFARIPDSVELFRDRYGIRYNALKIR